MSGAVEIPQGGNPLLYGLRDDYVVPQPYFVLLLQFLVFALCARLWNRLIYGTWLLPSEYLILSKDRNASRLKTRLTNGRTRTWRSALIISTIYIIEEWKKLSVKTMQTARIPTFDLFDLLFSALPLWIHTIWFIVIQSGCSSQADGTSWKCYNMFGYHLYNYVFSRYAEFGWQYLSKCVLFFRNREQIEEEMQKRKGWKGSLYRLIFYLTLPSSTMTFLFVGSVVLPYLFTNIIPMSFVYCVFVIIYIYLITVVIIIVEFVLYLSSFLPEESSLRSSLDRKIDGRKRVIDSAISLLPYLMSSLFNFSQSYYEQADYWLAIDKEVQSREQEYYFDRLKTQPDQVFHTVLTTL